MLRLLSGELEVDAEAARPHAAKVLAHELDALLDEPLAAFPVTYHAARAAHVFETPHLLDEPEAGVHLVVVLHQVAEVAHDRDDLLLDEGHRVAVVGCGGEDLLHREADLLAATGDAGDGHVHAEALLVEVGGHWRELEEESLIKGKYS